MYPPPPNPLETPHTHANPPTPSISLKILKQNIHKDGCNNGIYSCFPNYPVVSPSKPSNMWMHSGLLKWLVIIPQTIILPSRPGSLSPNVPAHKILYGTNPSIVTLSKVEEHTIQVQTRGYTCDSLDACLIKSFLLEFHYWRQS